MKIRKLSLLAITLMGILSGTVACVDVPSEEEVRDAIGAGDRDGDDEGRRNARREDGREDEEMTDEDGDGLFAEDDADDDGDGVVDGEE